MNVYITVIVSIVLVSSYVQGNAIKERRKTILAECQSKIKLDPEEAKKLNGDMIPENEQQRCYLSCYYEKTGLVSNNAFSPSMAKAGALLVFKGDELKKMNNMIENCTPIIKADPKVKCDIGRAVRDCFHHEGKKEGFFPKLD